MFWYEIFIINIFSPTSPINCNHSSGLVNRKISEFPKIFKQARTQPLASICVLYNFTKNPYWIIWKVRFASPFKVLLIARQPRDWPPCSNHHHHREGVPLLCLSVLFCTYCSHVSVTSAMSLKKNDTPTFIISQISCLITDGTKCFFLCPPKLLNTL